MGRGVARVERDRLLEVSDRGRNFRGVERLQADSALREGSIGFEAARIAERARLLAANPQRLRELRDDAILELEDVLEQTVGLGFGRRFSGRRVHHARGNPQARTRSLKAPDHRQVEVQVGPERREIARRLRFTDSTTRMRSTTRRGAVARRSLVTVSAMPDESHASSRSPLTLAKSSTAIDGSCVTGSGAVPSGDGIDAWVAWVPGAVVVTGAMKR